jgi:hypothetical protein
MIALRTTWCVLTLGDGTLCGRRRELKRRGFEGFTFRIRIRGERKSDLRASLAFRDRAQCRLRGTCQLWCGVHGVWIRDLTWEFRRGLRNFACRSAAHLRVCVTSSLSLCGGMCFSNLTFFAACGCFGDCCSFSAARGLDAFRGSGASSFFCFTQRAAHGRVGVVRLMVARCLRCLACRGFCGCCCSFCLGLSEQCLFAYLLCSTMS